MREDFFNIKRIKIISIFFALYAGFIYIDFFAPEFSEISDIFKFAVIVLSFGVSFLSPKFDGVLASALFFTLISDLLLLFTHYFELGVLIFSGAQVFHFLRHGSGGILEKIRQRAWILCFLPFMFLIDLGKIPKICFFYAICLGANLILSIYFAIKKPSAYTKLICFAFVLFVLCDLNVAAANITGKEIFYDIIWIFYAPSQIMFGLSPKFKKER